MIVIIYKIFDFIIVLLKLQLKKVQTIINDLYLRIKTKDKIIIDKIIIMFVIKWINWNEEDKKKKKKNLDRKNANMLFIW